MAKLIALGIFLALLGAIAGAMGGMGKVESKPTKEEQQE